MKLNQKVKAKALDKEFNGFNLEDRKVLARKFIEAEENNDYIFWLLRLFRLLDRNYNHEDPKLTEYLFDENSDNHHSNLGQEYMKQYAKQLSKKYNIDYLTVNKGGLSYFSQDNRVSNYIYSDSPFPTYIFEPDLLALEQKGNKDIDMYVEDIIERTQIAIDDANDDLKDIANRLVSKFETKRNSAELDLARDLYTIALKDGYNLGFSMILEFDDLFIDGITPEQREYLENNLRSNAEMMMKSIAKKNGFVLAGKEQDSYTEDQDILSVYKVQEQKEVDEEGAMARVQLKKIIENAQELLEMLKNESQLPAWVQSKLTLADHHLEASAGYLLYEGDEPKVEIYAEDMKALDSADIQRNIEIDENIARWLVNNNLEFDGNYIIFKLDGNDYTLTHRNETINFISDYDEYEGNPDELFDRIVNGDLREDFEKMLVGENAFLELWV